jgi:hypothetical protein
MSENIEAFWENATSDDVAGIANTRKPISARVRDEETEAWREDLISGWRLSRFLPGAAWIDADGVHWKHCQVYREPSWHANKPDPGPGFRLLAKFPDEPKLATDEAWDCHLKEWRQTFTDDGDQVKTVWYRRRIEPVEPVEHYLGRVEAIKQFIVGDTFWHPNGLLLKITEKGFEVAQ